MNGYKYTMWLNIALKVIFVAGAIIMALNNIPGYGWFIAGALLINFSYNSKE